jgi:hypothetical protein
MSKLDEALLQHMRYLVFTEGRPFSYREKRILQKPNIQELARWCIKHAVNASQDLVIQAKQVRQQQLLQKIRQQQMWQKQLNNSAPSSPSLGYNLQQQQQQNQHQKLSTIDYEM